MSVQGEQNRNQVYYDQSIAKCSAAQRAIVSALETGGLTRHEIASKLNMPLSTVCGRVSELEEIGLVRTTDETRMSPHGKPACIVIATFGGLVQQTFQFE
jgi:predicted transcriptional regulator